MALGTTGVLLVIAVGLANVFLSEMRINKMVYDGILAYSTAESTFEYAMLKAKNHREGFQDQLTASDIDSNLLSGTTPRTQNVKMTYDMKASSNNASFTLSGGEYLILPLFVGNDNLLVPGWTSKSPNFSTRTEAISELKISGLNGDTSWTILGMSGGVTIGISGTGTIASSLGTKGTMRNRGVDCYGIVGGNVEKVDCNGTIPILEENNYSFDKEMTVSDFLTSSNMTDRYISIFNNVDPATSTPITLQIETTGKFALPLFELTTTGRVGKTAQSLEYSEDKSRYYDALKYGLYNE